MRPAAEAFPLYWPEGWGRTRTRQPARFTIGQGGFVRVRDGLIREIELLGGSYVVLSTNLSVREDGLPYARQRNPEDPGVAVYWYEHSTGSQRCMACDRWELLVHNMRALQLSVAALRGLDRWGCSEVVARAFQGFSALPPSENDWRAVLGAEPYELYDEVRARYLSLAERAHPDRGGSVEEMQKINKAWELAQAELSK